ncbi:tetratricopeptide repeat protein [Noviherbaspirillum sp. ST9]|uniref:tetratricopeptide repeat protein n=1 Tax=Noviherbaspirillum sp. ST9 TaxID=3401606 RepID=UPI003B586615
MGVSSPDGSKAGHEQDVGALLQRAMQLHQSGDLNGAQPLYEKLLAVQPANVDALYLAGLLEYQRGDYVLAQRRLEAALRQNPSASAIHTALGNVFRESKDWAKAHACYQRAIDLDPAGADTHYNLGVTFQEQGDLQGAETAYRRALASNPGHPECWINLGTVLKERGNLGEAESCYSQALQLQPRHALAWYNLGVLQSAAMRFIEAVGSFRRALEIQPHYPAAAYNIGVACRSAGALEDASDWFNHVLTMQPGHENARHNLGAVLYELGRFDEAEGCFRTLLARSPGNPELNYNMSLLALARGDYASGWRAYEWRWLGAESSRRHRRDFSSPQWQGEGVAGKTILLHAEQGLGDALQFVRYAPMVADLGARVILECQAPLGRLLRSVRGVSLVVHRGDPLPAFDLHCPLMSLPLAFGTRIETVPAQIPYLAPDPVHVGQWGQRLGISNCMRVGLVWAGNPRRFSEQQSQVDRRRSLSLQQLVPLARCQGVEYISLQLGDAAEEARSNPAWERLKDVTRDIADFEDTAAIVANLDLVISVDTSVAHLAAAMGKPVWMLSRFDACWRWMRGRDDSPWYPGMQIFRQSRPGEWGDVIERVVERLEAVSKR